MKHINESLDELSVGFDPGEKIEINGVWERRWKV